MDVSYSMSTKCHWPSLSCLPDAALALRGLPAADPLAIDSSLTSSTDTSRPPAWVQLALKPFPALVTAEKRVEPCRMAPVLFTHIPTVNPERKPPPAISSAGRSKASSTPSSIRAKPLIPEKMAKSADAPARVTDTVDSPLVNPLASTALKPKLVAVPGSVTASRSMVEYRSVALPPSRYETTLPGVTFDDRVGVTPSAVWYRVPKPGSVVTMTSKASPSASEASITTG